jgi:hypothetical protein
VGDFNDLIRVLGSRTCEQIQTTASMQLFKTLAGVGNFLATVIE